MGILGYYNQIEDLLLSQIINGEYDILDFDSKQYQTLDIDKSWQAIHYLLCKNIENGKPPMGYVVPMRNENKLDCELDYGVFYITAQQVKAASDFLNSLDDTALKSMYDFKSMQENEVYPLYKNEEDTGFYEYLYFHLTELKKYFHETAEKGYAIIFYIS